MVSGEEAAGAFPLGERFQAAEHLTMSDMRALKCWMASSLLCCSRSRSISLVCSDRAFCTSRSRSRRLASMRACRSISRSFSMSMFCGRDDRRSGFSPGCYGIISSDISTTSWTSSYLGLFLHVLLVELFSEGRALHGLVARVGLQPLLHFAPPLAALYVLLAQEIKEVLLHLETETCPNSFAVYPRALASRAGDNLPTARQLREESLLTPDQTASRSKNTPLVL